MRGEVEERHSDKETEDEELELADVEFAAGAEKIAEFGLAVVGPVLDGRPDLVDRQLGYDLDFVNPRPPQEVVCVWINPIDQI